MGDEPYSQFEPSFDSFPNISFLNRTLFLLVIYTYFFQSRLLKYVGLDNGYICNSYEV